MNDTNLMREVTKGHASSVRLRAELEFRMLAALIDGCLAAGFTLHSIAADDHTVVTTREAAIRECFDFDTCTLRFQRGGKGRLFGVLLVFGNSGWDVVSDYTNDAGPNIMNPVEGSFAHAVESSTRELVERYS